MMQLVALAKVTWTSTLAMSIRNNDDNIVERPTTNSLRPSQQHHTSIRSMGRTVDETLDRMHTAAANAELESYFDCFSKDGYFIGTDSTERWMIMPDFYNYTKPYFDQGMGWTYTPVSRHVTYLDDQNLPIASVTAATADSMIVPPTAVVALFDEILSHERFGTTRNSGVMTLHPPTPPHENNFVWKIVQYHLTIPIPNRYVDTVVQIIRQTD